MTKEKIKHVKYRWVVLLAVFVWLATTVAIAAGTARRSGVTVTFAFVPLVMILVALAPASMPKVATHKWCIPVMSIWGGSVIVGIHFAGAWLMASGHECDRVVLIANAVGFGVLNVGWMVGKLYRRVAHGLQPWGTRRGTIFGSPTLQGADGGGSKAIGEPPSIPPW